MASVAIVVLLVAGGVCKAGSAHSEGFETAGEKGGSTVGGDDHGLAEEKGDAAGSEASEGKEPAEAEEGKRARRPLQFSRASSLIGMSVVNTKGEALGQIHDIVFDLEAKRVHYLVFATGGILGFGEKLLVLPTNAVVPHPTKPALIVNVEKKDLAEAKGLDSDSWPSIEAEELPDAGVWGKPPGAQSSAGSEEPSSLSESR